MAKSTMVKKVNVYAPIPIRTVCPPIHGRLEGVAMTPANILKCLIGRATVHEVLSDGSLLKLNTKNYNTENKPVVKKTYPVGKVSKPKSAIQPGETMKRIVIKDDIGGGITDVAAVIKTEEPEVVVESKPNMIDESTESAPLVMTEYSELQEDPEQAELREIEAEIARLEAEEAANKSE